MSDPLVSVIIPTRDRLEKLMQAIESVLSQSWKSIEIIVVDDGSVNDVNAALNSFFPDKVTFIRHDEPLGACAARNTGLMIANGDYIAFLDDDDLWLPDKLKKQLDLFHGASGNNLGLVGCGFHYQVEGQFVETQIPSRSKAPFKDLLLGNWIGGTSLPLIKRDKLENVGYFDVLFQSCQDWDLWLRISREFDIEVVQEPLVIRVIHQVQISGDLGRKIGGRKRLLKKYQAELEAHPLALTAHLRRLGTLELLFKNKILACRYFYQALKVKRTDLRSWAGLLMTMFPASLRDKILVTFALDRIGKYVLFY